MPCGLRSRPSVAGLELAEMFLLLHGEVLEHLPAARILRHARRARVEVEAAALGRDRNAQRITREDEIGVAAFERRGAAGAAFLARPVDLDHALRRCEVPGRRDFLDEALDVGAEELERPVTGLANEVGVPRLSV